MRAQRKLVLLVTWGNWLLTEPGRGYCSDFCVLYCCLGGWAWPQVLAEESREGLRVKEAVQSRGSPSWKRGGGR